MRKYHRNATIFAGIFTTVQGVIWAFVSVYSIGVYGCNFEFPFHDKKKLTVGGLLYFSYFTGNCRFSDLVPNIPPEYLNLTHPHRTYILMIIYGILSAVWIPSSILILVMAVNKIHGKRGSRCYWPWIITTCLLLLFDIVNTIIYCIDISHSMTNREYQEYFNYTESLKGMDGLTVLPAVIMTAYSSRAIVIFIINAVIFGVVIQASIALRRLNPAAAFVESDVRMAPSKGYGPTSSWVRMAKKPGGATEMVRVEEVDLARVQDQPPPQTLQSLEHERRLERPSNLALDVTRRPPKPALKPLPLSSPSSPPPPPPAINSPAPVYDVFGKPTTPDSPQPAVVRTRNPLGDGVNNKVPWSYMLPQQPPPKSIPDADHSIHPKRNSPPINRTPSEESDNSSLPRRSEGVNKNIPWSYMSPQQPLPRHIPEPDYTIRQKKPSPTTPNVASDENDIFTSPRKYENNPNMWKVM